MKWKGGKKEGGIGGGNARRWCVGNGVDSATSYCVQCARWRKFSCKLVTWNVVVITALVVVLVVIISPWEEHVESWTEGRRGRIAATQATASSRWWDIETVRDDWEC